MDPARDAACSSLRVVETRGAGGGLRGAGGGIPGACYHSRPPNSPQMPPTDVDIEQVANALEELDVLMPSGFVERDVSRAGCACAPLIAATAVLLVWGVVSPTVAQNQTTAKPAPAIPTTKNWNKPPAQISGKGTQGISEDVAGTPRKRTGEIAAATAPRTSSSRWRGSTA